MYKYYMKAQTPSGIGIHFSNKKTEKKKIIIIKKNNKTTQKHFSLSNKNKSTPVKVLQMHHL